MKTKLRQTALKCVVILGLGSIGLASVASPGGMGGDMPGRSPERMVTHMTKMLDLSAQQAEQIKALLEAGRDSGAEDQKRIEQLRGELMVMQADFDPGAAQKIADEVGEITSRLTYLRASTHAEIGTLLSPEQQQELQQFSERRQAKRGERKPRRGHGDDDL